GGAAQTPRIDAGDDAAKPGAEKAHVEFGRAGDPGEVVCATDQQNAGRKRKLEDLRIHGPIGRGRDAGNDTLSVEKSTRRIDRSGIRRVRRRGSSSRASEKFSR